MILQSGKPFLRLSPWNAQCLANNHTRFSSSHLQRVAALYNSFQWQHKIGFTFNDSFRLSESHRTYATRPVSRPKAHTGRTTTAARKAPTTSQTKAAKKPAPKKTAAKATPKAKSKAKPRIRAKPKSAKKAKAKPKSRKPKKALTEAQKKAATIKELRAVALRPPVGTASTAWLVFSQESIKASKLDSGGIGARVKQASAQFKELSPERLEHYNHIANQNKAANAAAYREWIESHTPLVIFNANLARQNLRRRGSSPTKRLQDHRQVKGLRSPYTYFSKERFSTGDFKGLKIPEAARLVAREWKALSSDEKKPYEDAAKQDMARYTQERKTVFNKDVQHKPKRASAA